MHEGDQYKAEISLLISLAMAPVSLYLFSINRFSFSRFSFCLVFIFLCFPHSFVSIFTLPPFSSFPLHPFIFCSLFPSFLHSSHSFCFLFPPFSQSTTPSLLLLNFLSRTQPLPFFLSPLSSFPSPSPFLPSLSDSRLYGDITRGKKRDSCDVPASRGTDFPWTRTRRPASRRRHV